VYFTEEGGIYLDLDDTSRILMDRGEVFEFTSNALVDSTWRTLLGITSVSALVSSYKEGHTYIISIFLEDTCEYYSGLFSWFDGVLS
jgi:hypothetical protein